MHAMQIAYVTFRNRSLRIHLLFKKQMRHSSLT